ncbi:MAG: hypothetical protein KIT58_08545 [Planctomycetota bacterium]|nr:hypothetical protein [Planctomycetota bacterium]
MAADLERFAQDVAKNRFPEWGVQILREGERMRLVGQRDGSRFDAAVVSDASRVVLSLRGVAELGFLKYTAAGGAEGVRERVRASLLASLRQQFGG